ncbi:cytochrome c-type biogenesis protein CcmF [bacterium BMS3Abin05]|nr:cytochrome c-type biogenesis protein CcmF [bacterium BMS3Abin05]GBE27744.1 cytochrome c-type biogenesis protein CcmF [bacterium BMS3Bbin03]
MIELGSIGLKLSLVFSIYIIIASFTGIKNRMGQFLVSSHRAIYSSFLLISLAMIILTQALITKNYELKYVAEHVSNHLPVFYAITALWAGQSGSLLLWVWLLSLFGVIVVLQNRHKSQNQYTLPYVNLVLGSIQLFFLIILVFTSDPFEKATFHILEGQGLNPLLQNPGMIFHPPTLYLGYVGFAIPFAFAIAALITRRLDNEWIKTTRRWTLFSWLFLSIGILLGAKWAYVELGWGGYWAWDPVENASLLPWLTGTAFLHSVMIQERKDMLKIWNMVLIVLTFLLTIFGTFVTRSGIISSVHSFGNSNLGPLFLLFMFWAIVSATYLIISRREDLRSRNQLDSVLSRESSFLFNNLIFVAATFAILWGTLFPIISEAVRGIKITVGPPFFNTVNVPIAIALILLTGICPLISWRKATMNNFLRNFLIPSAVFFTALILLFAVGIRKVAPLLTFSLSAFVLTSIFFEFYRGTLSRIRYHDENIFTGFKNLIFKHRKRYGGYVVHTGMILIFIGIAGSSSFKTEKEKTMKKGDTIKIANYELTFTGLDQYNTPNAQVSTASFRIKNGNKYEGLATPSKHYHPLQKQTMTEVYISSNLREDLYLILGSINTNGSVFIKAEIIPLVAWIWIGGYILIVGTLFAMWPSKKKKSFLETKPLAKKNKEFVQLPQV